ncbi:MAG: CoA transferase [Myxococcota bacterium]
MLSPVRVLDLSDERGIVCGWMLAELGADVICIEPPGGSYSSKCVSKTNFSLESYKSNATGVFLI